MIDCIQVFSGVTFDHSVSSSAGHVDTHVWLRAGFSPAKLVVRDLPGRMDAYLVDLTDRTTYQIKCACMHDVTTWLKEFFRTVSQPA